MRLLSHFASATLRGLDCCACGCESSANIFLFGYVTSEGCLRERHFSLQLLAMSRSLLEIIGHFPVGEALAMDGNPKVLINEGMGSRGRQHNHIGRQGKIAGDPAFRIMVATHHEYLDTGLV